MLNKKIKKNSKFVDNKTINWFVWMHPNNYTNIYVKKRKKKG